jgi:hypothetical protein
MGLIRASSAHSLSALGHPLQQTILAGGTVTFSAAQYANRLSTFQWQFDGSNIAGATNSTLTLGNLSWTSSGIYRAIISNQAGSIFSPAMSLTVPALLFDPSSLSYQATTGAFGMRLTGSSGAYPVVIYATTNLIDWTPVFTNAPTTNVIYFMDSSTSAGPSRFYRAVEQP